MNKQSGQILLITVMLIATVITVVMTLVFKSTTETQITKLEQEAERALVAAESALEKAIKTTLPAPEYSLSFSGLGLSNLTGIDLVNSSVSLDIPATTSFVSPLTQKDEQYIFYFTGFDNINHTFDSNYYSGDITFYFASEAGSYSCSGSRTTPGLEVTLISSTNVVTRKLIEPCNGIGTDISASSGSYKIIDTTFQYRASSAITVNNTKVIIVRPFFAGSKIGMVSAGADLKPQGSYLVSEAKSYSGVVKKIRLFQSYPQIPAEFFVTSF